MARMTKKLQPNNVIVYKFGKYEDTISAEMETSDVRTVLKALADYEDAEEQGLLLRLPCKVGDTVFLVQRRRVYERKVSGFSVTSNNRFVVHMQDCEMDNATFPVERFGETVFLTREEAESALAEKGGV